ncbi:MAG: hypothetical protein U1E70_10880 [Acetobacteraceae bacterium]
MEYEARVAKVRSQETSEVEAVERRLLIDTRYVAKRQRYTDAKERYDIIAKRHQNRPAMMWASDWRILYVLCLLAIGSVEWLINYDILYRFFQIPAWAAGVTIALGLAVALASHGLGVLIKQGAHRFHHRHYGRRSSDWGLLALSLVSILAVLAVAGASRYVVYLHDIADTCKPDVFGRPVVCDIHPARDVLISLFGNGLAILVGILFSWYTHDEDPDYMAVTADFRQATRHFHRARRRAEREIAAIHLRADKEVKHISNEFGAAPATQRQ